MNRRRFLSTLGPALMLTHARHTTAQEKTYRIGLLMRAAPDVPIADYLREGLRDAGYVEGKNLVLEVRNNSGAGVEEIRPLAQELVDMNVDLIVTFSTPAARAAVEATKTIPVVFTAAGDPISTGLVTSLARPGTNATGVSIIASELAPKRLDLLHQLAPHAQRVLFLINLANPSADYQLEPVTEAARKLGLKLEIINARNAAETDQALASLAWKSAQAVAIGGDTVQLALGAKIAKAVRAGKLPAVFPWREYHKYGVVMSYGADFKDVMRRGAYYVDKILKGANPAELPVEQVSNFHLVIDLRVAQSMGIKVPQGLLYRADEVIR